MATLDRVLVRSITGTVAESDAAAAFDDRPYLEMAQRVHRGVALPIGAPTDIPISHSSDLAEDPRVTDVVGGRSERAVIVGVHDR